MPTRATKLGSERIPLSARHDVLICGASFAGLAVARELTGAGASVLVVDRYEIGERPTSACGIPTDWLRALGLVEIELQRFGELVVHTPGGTAVLDLPYTFSTFNYDEMCELLWRECDATFETATVVGRGTEEDGANLAVETDRGPVSAPLVVDALGWRRILATDGGFQPLDAPLTRALEVHPPGRGKDLEVWVDPRYVPAGYGWSFPAGDELRIGVCSYDPRSQVREGTDLLAADLGRERVRYQGNWIPHELRSTSDGGVFFAGDSAGQCLPLTAEGIRTALYYGIALGRELRAVVEGRRSREQATARYARLHESHRKGFRLLLFVQRLIPRIPPRMLAPLFRIYKSQPLVNLTFNAYLRLAPPGFVGSGSADDEDRPGQQQRDADHALRAERNLVQTEQA
jgi:flavin-dependent dehydrogenase